MRFEAILEGRWKLTGTQLFDLERDPGESVDLATPGAAKVAHLRALLAAATSGVPPKSVPVTLSAETEIVLRSLGYLSGSRK